MGWKTLSQTSTAQPLIWSLGMDRYSHPTLYNGCNYLSMLGFKLIPFGQMDPWYIFLGSRISFSVAVVCSIYFIFELPQRNTVIFLTGNLFLVPILENTPINLPYCNSTEQQSLRFRPGSGISRHVHRILSRRMVSVCLFCLYVPAETQTFSRSQLWPTTIPLPL